MSKVDIDIYVNQMIRFFDNNPKDLFTLIGNLSKDIFYERIRKTAINNYDENGDAALTQKQLIDIVVGMFNEDTKKKEPKEIEGIFVNTKFGKYCLN
jgi:hypothetical protein